MENVSHLIDLIRLITGIIILVYASYSDLKTRRASNVLWILMVFIGCFLIFFELFIVGFTSDFLYLLFVPIMIIIMYVFFQLRLIFGGADAKALMALSILVPLFPEIYFIPYLENSFMPFPWIIFSNSILLFLFIPISLMFFNIFKKRFDFPYLFLGYKMSIEAAKNKFVWPLEKIINGKRKFSYMPKDFDINKDLLLFEEKGIMEIWVTPKIPFMIPLLVGFIFSFVLGDLLFFILNILL